MLKLKYLIFLCVLLFSCENKNSKPVQSMNKKSNLNDELTDSIAIIKTLPPLPESTPFEKLPSEFYLKIVKPKNIDFKYYISELKNPAIKDSKRLHCSLKNLNDFPVYLLAYTCSDIPGKLIVEPITIDCWQEVNCNISYAYIYKIDAKKDFTFSTNIRIKKKSELKNLDLNVSFVNRYETFEFLKEHPEILKNIYNTQNSIHSYLQGVEK